MRTNSGGGSDDLSLPPAAEDVLEEEATMLFSRTFKREISLYIHVYSAQANCPFLDLACFFLPR